MAARSASPATGTTDAPELPRPQFAAGEEHRQHMHSPVSFRHPWHKAMSSTAARANLSTAGLRALARVRREAMAMQTCRRVIDNVLCTQEF